VTVENKQEFLSGHANLKHFLLLKKLSVADVGKLCEQKTID